jgi:hypothetical protein
VTNELTWTPLQLGCRWALAGLAVISALAHLPLVGEHLYEAPYMGWEFIVFIVACLLIAIAAATFDTAALYAVAAMTGGLAVAGYFVTRVIALPGLGHDVGDWFEPLGVVAVLAETAMVLVAVVSLRSACAGRAFQHPAESG